MGTATVKEAITLASRVRISEDVVFRDLQGEMVLLNLKSGVYFGLDPMGTQIWQLIQEHQFLHNVLQAVVEEYEVTESRCQQDLLRFVAAVRENGLVDLDRGPAA